MQVEQPIALADVICFDTVAQRSQPQRLVAWASFHRLDQARHETLQFRLPHKVMTRFITAVFIESENYLQADGDEFHPTCNVDVQGILFHGQKVLI